MEGSPEINQKNISNKGVFIGMFFFYNFLKAPGFIIIFINVYVAVKTSFLVRTGSY